MLQEIGSRRALHQGWKWAFKCPCLTDVLSFNRADQILLNRLPCDLKENRYSMEEQSLNFIFYFK